MNNKTGIIKISSFINNEYVESSEYMDSLNPATTEKIADIGLCTESQLIDAINAAKNAFPIWSSLTPRERSNYLMKLADLLERDIEEFAKLESMDQGKTINQALKFEMPRVVDNFRFYATKAVDLVDMCTEQHEASSMNIITRSAVGVTAIISPWNLPLYLLTIKLAPCLIFGNTCVCKPSEFTSLTTWKLSKLIIEAGFPAGVVNIVFGEGKSIGYSLVSNPDVKLITFTGSTATGKIIQKDSTSRFKKLSFEMGGKNAAIVFDDITDEDFNKTVECCVRSSFTNQGEVCLSTSRIYVQEKIYPKFIKAFLEKTKQLKVGDPTDTETFMGAIVSKIHYDKVKWYLDNTKGEKLCGYGVDQLDLPPQFQEGYFILPTIVVNVADTDPIMVDEVFGPVTAVTTFTDTADVIRRVNNTDYGLCASVHCSNISRAISVSKQLEVGTVWINTWLVLDHMMPFGGFKSSGIGRESLQYSREFYTEPRAICIKYQ